MEYCVYSTGREVVVHAFNPSILKAVLCGFEASLVYKAFQVSQRGLHREILYRKNTQTERINCDLTVDWLR